MADHPLAPAIETLHATQNSMIDSLRHLNPAIWYGTIAENHLLWRSLLADERLADSRRLERFGHKSYSQNEEDGIVAEIFNRIGAPVTSFIEFGVGNGLENNTLLWLKGGAKGLWIDADDVAAVEIPQRFAAQIAAGQLHFRHALITAENIDGIIENAGFAGEVDLLSIDIDFNDYYVFDAIRSVSAKVVVIEYNAKFPPPTRFRVPYTAAYRWEGTDWFGASLQSFEELFSAHGYRLVACNITGSNAFFVRSDLVTEARFHPPFSAANHYHPQRFYLHFGLFAHVGGHPADPRPGIVDDAR